MLSRQLTTLLSVFDQGHISERALSYLLSLHTFDVLEKKVTSNLGFEVVVYMKDSRYPDVFMYRTKYSTVKAAVLCQQDSSVTRVVIRPTFPERDENGNLLIREWASVNGDLFSELRQQADGKVTKTVIHVLDLPTIPSRN